MIDNLPSWITVQRTNLSEYEEKVIRSNSIMNSSSLFNVLKEKMSGLLHEEMVVACLNGQNKLMHLVKVAQGGRHNLSISVCDIFRVPCAIGAAGIILAHNHPSGDLTPSKEDIIMTNEVVKVGELMSIPLVEHIIIADNKYLSFADSGLI